MVSDTIEIDFDKHEYHLQVIRDALDNGWKVEIMTLPDEALEEGRK